jgi:hypothetical protein
MARLSTRVRYLRGFQACSCTLQGTVQFRSKQVLVHSNISCPSNVTGSAFELRQSNKLAGQRAGVFVRIKEGRRRDIGASPLKVRQLQSA